MQIFAPDRVEKYNFSVDRLKNSLSALLDVTGDKKVLDVLHINFFGFNSHKFQVLLASLQTADLGDALLKVQMNIRVQIPQWHWLQITGEGSDPALLIPTMRMLARITNLKEQVASIARAFERD